VHELFYENNIVYCLADSRSLRHYITPVLAYSGGLDTSVILKWLQESYQCPVVAFAADLGQDEDWDAVREKGMTTGAEKVVITDLKETFVKDFIFPAFRANAIYEGSYLLGTSLARPLIAREQVRLADANYCTLEDMGFKFPNPALELCRRAQHSCAGYQGKTL
jgi:hypothetical protein